MKTLPLTKGQVAFVDDEDFEFLNQWKWSAVKGNTGPQPAELVEPGWIDDRGTNKIAHQHGQSPLCPAVTKTAPSEPVRYVAAITVSTRVIGGSHWPLPHNDLRHIIVIMWRAT